VKPLCAVDPKHGPVWAREWCHPCYNRWWQHGDPEYVRPPREVVLCSVDPLHGPQRSLGYCNSCYRRVRNGKDPRVPVNRGQRLCSIDPSHGPTKARGWCPRCYARWQSRGGDPGVPAPRSGRHAVPLEERYTITKSGCHEWSASRNKAGYGTVGRGYGESKRSMLAHRFVYEMLVGPIPEGMVLDHLCANPPCVNTDHLEPVTRKENKRRGGEPHFELRGTVAA